MWKETEGEKSCGPYLRRYKSGREWLPTKSGHLVGEILKDKSLPFHPVKVPRSRTRTMTAQASDFIWILVSRVMEATLSK